MLPGFSGSPNLGSPWPCGRQPLDLLSGVRTTWASLLAAIIFPGDQPAMPAQQCCWRHDRGQFIKHAPAQFLGPDCQAPALVIVKTEPLASELFAQHAVLLLQIVDHLLLALV